MKRAQISGRASIRGPASIGRPAWIWGAACGFLTTLFAAILSSVVFGRIPHVQDSIAQLFQARIFAGGRLWAPSPPLREFFEYAHMINDGRWYSQYPPGHPLLLVPGVWLGIPWLINPILAGLAVFAVYLVARELSDEITARIAALLGLLSPFLILMASEFMSHVSGFCLLTYYLYFHFRALRTGRTGPALAGASCLALAILVRPYTAFAVALPVLVHAAWRLYKDRAHERRLYKPALVFFAGGAAGALILALYNAGTTGDAFTPGYVRLYGPSHGLGFGRGSWGPPHTLIRGLKGAWENLRALNHRLFEWPLTSLWPIAVALLPAGRGRGAADAGGVGRAGDVGRGDRAGTARRGDGTGDVGRADGAGSVLTLRHTLLLVLIPVSLQAAYVLYWYHDLCFGPRYLYESLAPLLILSAFGIHRTVRFLGDRLRLGSSGANGAGGPSSRKRLVPGGILFLGLFAYAAVVGWPALFRGPAGTGGPPGSPERMASYFQRFGQEFWGVSPHLGNLVDEKLDPHTQALVFVHFTEPSFDEMLQMRYLWFGSAFAREAPDLAKARVIYAKDLGSQNERLAALFPTRPIYLYTGSIEGGVLREIPRRNGGMPSTGRE